jgi:hypothetical protein
VRSETTRSITRMVAAIITRALTTISISRLVPMTERSPFLLNSQVVGHLQLHLRLIYGAFHFDFAFSPSSTRRRTLSFLK